MDLMDRYLGLPVDETMVETVSFKSPVQFEQAKPVIISPKPIPVKPIPDRWEKYRHQSIKKIRTTGYYNLIKREREQKPVYPETEKLDWNRINHKVDDFEPPNQLIGPRTIARGDKILVAY